MATTLTKASIKNEIRYTIEESDDLFPDPPEKVIQDTYAGNPAGTGSGATFVATKLYSKTHTIAGGGTLSLDLAGSMTDPFGNAVTFSKVKLLSIKLNSGGASSVTLNGGATNTFSDFTATLPGGSHLTIAIPTSAGEGVVAGTGDILEIVNNDGSTAADVEIFISGE